MASLNEITTHGTDSYIAGPACETSPGIYTLQECLKLPNISHIIAEHDYNWHQTEILHSQINSFLLVGDDKTLLFDTCSPQCGDSMLNELNNVLDNLGLGLDYLVASHDEAAHAGNLQKISEAHPEAKIVFREPNRVDPAFHSIPNKAILVTPGETIDLGGGRIVEFLDPVFQDAAITQWMYDRLSKSMFTVDSFGMYHNEDECQLCEDELDSEITSDRLYEYNGRIFQYLPYCDATKVIQQLDKLFDTYDISNIYPSHGSPIREDVEKYKNMMEKVTEMTCKDGVSGRKFQ